MGDMTIDDARHVRDAAKRAHERNEARGTEYRVDAGLVYEALKVALAGLDEARSIAEQERERGREALRKGMAAAQEKHDAMRAAEARAEAAEAALVALREAADALHDACCNMRTFEGTSEQREALCVAMERAEAVATDTRAAAEAYRARVRAEVLREAADEMDEMHAQAPFVRASISAFEAWLRKKAEGR